MCTNFKIKKAKDGSVVVGRTEEFPLSMPWNLGVLPSDHRGEGAAPEGSQAKGKEWKAKYGMVGISCFGKPNWYTDALSEAGISAHAQYMDSEDFCAYQDFKGDGSDLSELDVIGFLLGTCSSLKEVRAAVADVNIWGLDPGMGLVPPLHFLMHDKDESLAIEFHPEGARVVENPLGVGTNAPYLDWHYINAGNYLGMSTTNPEEAHLNGVEIAPLGEGQGLMGLPAGTTSPSRFVRALAQVTASDQPADSHEAEQLTLHILNNFDITPGLNRMSANGKLVDEDTDWSSVCNLTGLRYAYRTFYDPKPFVIDLGKTDFTGEPRIGKLPAKGEFEPATV
jgi:choloylglycine hydrolase